MKKRLLSLLLALVFVFSCSAVAFAANQYAGMYSGIAGNDEAVYVTDTFNKIIWKYANGSVTRFAGKIAPKDMSGEPVGAYVDSNLDQARFMEPWAMAPFLDGWAVSDAAAHVIRYVDEKGVRTLAGSGRNATENGSGKGASFMRPTGLAADDKGNLYVADSDAGVIRKIDSKGSVSIYYSNLSEPTGLCWSNDVLYCAETGLSRIVKIVGGALTVIAGGSEGFRDGNARTAQFSYPLGVTANDDAVYVADTGNSAIRKIENGTVSTLVSPDDEGFNIVAPRSMYVSGDYLLITDNFTGQIIIKKLAEAGFSDVPEKEWFAPFVKAAAERRIVNGTGGGEFAPEDEFTRAQLVTVLSRLEQERDRNLVIYGESDFSDVKANAYYADAVGWAAENHIVDGYPDGSFDPDAPITRADIATMLYRYAKSIGMIPVVSTAAQSFPDYGEIPGYAKDAVNWAVSKGIMNGSDGMLLPLESATRAEAIKLIMSFAAL